ncbi:hypothetical protein PpBr36_03206 [Pyricularia pennisetigena]|uniref:hypothetical protein n=1 Tax=Pyricularia pennisetigena TaxID=1578925 RepID=UPI001151CF16|nr:hypothetical protein PpBr36_03206 [Pyricularia pennisetigena]TLS31275.1 hypothetical protein PpBr36_03206 [Pyricularia pennisetigena]
MRSTSIILLATAALAPFVAGTELKIDSKDVPSACAETCSDIQELTEMCYNKRDKNNSDKSEAACVCPSKEFDVASAAIACQKCFAAQKASNDQRENIDRVVRTCNFSDSGNNNNNKTTPTLQQSNNKASSPPGLMPTLPPALASSCIPVTVTVTVSMGGNYTGLIRPTVSPSKPGTPTPTRPPTTPTPARPSGTLPAGNATRPGTPIPTAAASSVNPGFQLAALAAFVYLLA